MDGVIHHEYFYPEGPETVEYLLEVSDQCDSDDAWIQSLRGLNSAEIVGYLKTRFQRFTEGPVSGFCARLLECKPKSLVTYEEEWLRDGVPIQSQRSWLLLALRETSEPSEFGNILMLSPPNEAPFDLIADSQCREFLRESAGTCNTIPPSNGFCWPKRLDTFKETSDANGFVPEEWRGSIEFYNIGTGDVLVIRPDGVIGATKFASRITSVFASPLPPSIE